MGTGQKHLMPPLATDRLSLVFKDSGRIYEPGRRSCPSLKEA